MAAATLRRPHRSGTPNRYAVHGGSASRHNPRSCSRPGCRLAEWRSERSWISRYGEVTPTRPDGLGRWEEASTRIEFFLEYDRSTEQRDRLVAKMPGYEELECALGRSRWVLFSFATPRREACARAALAGTTALVDLVADGQDRAARGDLGATRHIRQVHRARALHD